MPAHDRYLIARRATVVNSSINLLLAILKIILGFFGNSAALIADGIHSFSDLITDALVLFAAKIGTQQPDKKHPYGYRRVETIATIIIALILAGVAIGIAYETLSPIFSDIPVKKPSFFVIIVAGISIVANEFLYHYTLYESHKIHSDLLKSNAWHNRSDALVSIVVFISVLGSTLGAPYLDAIGALMIAILILVMAIKMIWRAIKELIDTAVDENFNDAIVQAILHITGVNAIHQLRTRYHGDDVFVDVHIEVDPMMTLSEAHYISEQVNIQLIKRFKRIRDVTVHMDPESESQFALSKDIPDRKTILALLEERWNFPEFHQIKKIYLHYLAGKLTLEIILPLHLLENQKKIQENFNRTIADIPYLKELVFLYQ